MSTITMHRYIYTSNNIFHDPHTRDPCNILNRCTTTLSFRHEMTTLSNSPIAITTTTNRAYELIKHGGQEGRLDDGEYENIPPAEELYEDPSSPPLQQPLPSPTVPPPAVLPTSGNVGGAREAVYEPIPGDS